MPDASDPRFSPSETYEKMEARMAKLTDVELCMLTGAVVGEFVNRGNDHDTAYETVVEAARGGVVGSQMFDEMED